MKIIKVKKRDLPLADYKQRSALESDFKNLITESCIVIDDDTNAILVIYKDLDELGFDDKQIRRALNSIRYEVSTRTAGLKTTSRIFGFSPRNVLRKDFCSTTSLALESPKEHEIICNYGKKLASVYENGSPEAYKNHEEKTIKEVGSEWVIPTTPFTSGIINKNNPLKYHFDSGNFKGVYSCMAVFKKDISGGYLACPEYDVGFELKNNSAFMFDGQSILHGVTPIKRRSKEAYRYSIVYYSLRQMWQCLPINEELLRIRKLKTERERKRATRLMESKQDESKLYQASREN